MESLLEMAGLKDRLIANVEEIEKVKEIDYTQVKNNIKIQVEKSKEFINKSIFNS